MKRIQLLDLVLIVSLALVFMGCPSSTTSKPDPIDSTIVFADGTTVTKVLGTGAHSNAVSGVGTGEVSFTSGTPATATVNSSTGSVTLVAVGTTVITANKAATATHSAVSGTYILTVTKTIPDPIASTIVFADGATVTKVLGTGSYSIAVSGVGTGEVSFTSGTPATATVNSSTGSVTLVATGTTVITANKAATATHSAVSASYTLTVGSNYTSAIIGTLQYVPAGSFQRDATPENISVITQGYGMSKYEITRAQFLVVMGTDPSENQNAAADNPPGTDPVHNVNWYHAIAFCNKLSISEGLNPVYDVEGFANNAAWIDLAFADIPKDDTISWNEVTADLSKNGYRLPTETEWMWAAMGAPADGQAGGTNTSSYLKAFAGSTGSNALGDYTVFGYYADPAELGATTTKTSNTVGSKLPNELGLYDMSGNVSEWNWDIKQETLYGQTRVYSGGDWGSGSSACSVAPFYGGFAADAHICVGFRVVRP